MEKPMIYLQRYEIDKLSFERNSNEENKLENGLNFEVKIAVSDDNKQGAVKLEVSLSDVDNKKKIFASLVGYFDVNVDDNLEEILYINGTAILYPYLRSIISIISTIDSSEAVLLPTINVMELISK